MGHRIVTFCSWLIGRFGLGTPSSMSHRFDGHPPEALTGLREDPGEDSVTDKAPISTISAHGERRRDPR